VISEIEDRYRISDEYQKDCKEEIKADIA